MVNKDRRGSLSFLIWLLVIIVVVIIALVVGMNLSNDGEIQAPGDENRTAVEIV